MAKIRKSFDIEPSKLEEVKQQADAFGISTWRFIQEAIDEKLRRADAVSLIQEMESRVIAEMGQVRREIERVRNDLQSDYRNLAERMVEDNQRLLKTTDQQIRVFIQLLRSELAPAKPAPARDDWTPGSR